MRIEDIPVTRIEIAEPGPGGKPYEHVGYVLGTVRRGQLYRTSTRHEGVRIIGSARVKTVMAGDGCCRADLLMFATAQEADAFVYGIMTADPISGESHTFSCVRYDDGVAVLAVKWHAREADAPHNEGRRLMIARTDRRDGMIEIGYDQIMLIGY